MFLARRDVHNMCTTMCVTRASATSRVAQATVPAGAFSKGSPTVITLCVLAGSPPIKRGNCIALAVLLADARDVPPEFVPFAQILPSAASAPRQQRTLPKWS